MSRLVTLSRSSPEFQSYLLGTFSKTERAKVIHSAQLNSPQEQITFEVIPIENIQRPSWGVLVFQWLRIRRLFLVLFPLFFVGLQIPTVSLDPWLLLLVSISLICLFCSTQLLNDYNDHLSGFDRISTDSGSRVIQNGWVTAQQSRSVGRWLFALGLLCALPLVWVRPWLLALTAVAGFLLYIAHEKFLVKARIWGVWIHGFLVGPLLVMGLELLFTDRITLSSLSFGLLWGLLVLFVFLTADFETILPQAQAGYRTWMSELGFDRGRKFLQQWWGLCLGAFVYYHALEGNWWVSTPGLLVILYFSWKWFRLLRGLQTPAGSHAQKVREQSYSLFVLTTTVWTIETVFLYWIKVFLSLWSQS